MEELNSKTVYKTKQTNMFYTTFTLEVAVYTEGATITLCSCLVLASYAVKWKCIYVFVCMHGN